MQSEMIRAINDEDSLCCARGKIVSPPAAPLASAISVTGVVAGGSVDSDRSDLPILHYHGAADDVIGASLALAGAARLARLGYNAIDFRLQPKLGHCEFPCCRTEMAALGSALMVSGPSLAHTRGHPLACALCAGACEPAPAAASSEQRAKLSRNSGSLTLD